MQLEHLNPFIRYATLHQTYHVQKENSICYDCRLFYILQGEGKFFANGQFYNVSEGFCAFLPPKTHYKFIFSDYDNVKIYVLNFDLNDQFCEIKQSLGTARESTYSSQKELNYPLPQEFSKPIVQTDCLLVQNPIANCVDLFLQKTAYYKHSASAYLKLSLINLLCESRNEKDDYRLVQAVQEFIRNHYQEAELSNQIIAEKFNYHSYHLNRLMKEHTHKTLRDYLIEYRLRMAKNYLRTTSLNVTEIAEKTGFCSYTYFIKIFRERTGYPPLQYRKLNENTGF